MHWRFLVVGLLLASGFLAVPAQATEILFYEDILPMGAILPSLNCLSTSLFPPGVNTHPECVVPNGGAESSPDNPESSDSPSDPS